jgi:LPS export ABC transporter protein LptC
LSVLFALVAVGIFIGSIILLTDTKKEASEGSFFRQKKNSFSNVRFKTYDRAGREISVKSDSVSENRKDHYTLEKLVSTFALSDGELLTVSADVTDAVRNDKAVCEFTGNVKLSTKSGLLLQTEKLFADCDKKIAKGDTAVVISREDMRVSADKYFFDMDANSFTLTGSAEGSFKTGKISSDKLIIRFSDINKKDVKSMDALGNAIYVTTNYTLKAEKSILYTADEVKAQQNANLFYRQNSKSYYVRANFMRAQIHKGAPETITANGSLIIKTKDATIRADKGILTENEIKVFENVVISGEQGNIFGNAAVLNTKTGAVTINKLSGILKDERHK